MQRIATKSESIQEGKRMQKQTIEFATVTKNRVVRKICKSYIEQPKTNFKGGSVKWYKDIAKKKTD